MHPGLYLFHLFPVFGIIMIYVGIKNISKITNKFREWDKVKARITALKEEKRYEVDSGTSRVFYPIFHYVFSGESYTVKSSLGSYPPAYKVGEVIDVYVNPHTPEEAEIINKSYIFMATVFPIVIMGLPFLIGGTCLSYFIFTHPC